MLGCLGPFVGWPATEWETGLEPKMAKNWPAKRSGHFSGVFQNSRKMARQMAGQAENLQILAGQPFVQPFFGHFEHPRKTFRRPFLGHFWF